MAFLPSSYSIWGVIASLLIVVFASYVAIELSKRVRTADGRFAFGWWLGGSLAMGTGVWCMHFLGMLALSLQVAVGHAAELTFLSWIAAFAVAKLALYLASRATLGAWQLASAAVAMGAGLCAMHYVGMAGIDLASGIVWNPFVVAASALVAVAASAAVLRIFFLMRTVSAPRALRYQIVAALVMGAAISAVHYTSMAAARLPAGAVGSSAGADAAAGSSTGALGGATLGAMAALGSAALLTLMLAGSLRSANSQLHTVNETLRMRAFEDPLTGLPNRLLFEDRLAQALRRCERSRERTDPHAAHKVAVLFVDLDRFKIVNDSFGHAAGDLVLKETALRLRVAARDSDTVARIGGDEFLLLMQDVISASDTLTMAQRLVEVLARPFNIAGRPVQVFASVGIVVHPDHGHRDKLIANADAAMYAAKNAGGNTHAFLAAHMDARSARADEPAGRHASGRRARSARALLPAQGRRAARRDPRRRGLAALAPPIARHRLAERVHTDRRTLRPDQRRGQLGHRRDLSPDPGVGRRRPAHAGGHQPVGRINCAIPIWWPASTRRWRATASALRNCCARSPRRWPCRISRPRSAPSPGWSGSVSSCRSTISAPATRA